MRQTSACYKIEASIFIALVWKKSNFHCQNQFGWIEFKKLVANNPLDGTPIHRFQLQKKSSSMN